MSLQTFLLVYFCLQIHFWAAPQKKGTAGWLYMMTHDDTKLQMVLVQEVKALSLREHNLKSDSRMWVYNAVEMLHCIHRWGFCKDWRMKTPRS